MTAMDETTRRDYLQSLGIDVWLPRAGRMPASLAVPVSKTVPDTAPAGSVPASDWPLLQSEVAACTRCALHRSRANTVFGVGATSARWMVIGEAPGADEDAQGEPFVGRAGQLLTAMLKACGLERPDVFIANILKCRPPNNRDPLPEEVRECLPYLTRQIARIRPQLILAVGRIAAQNLLATDAPLGRLRGQVHRYGELDTPLVVTYHPAYLLRSPGEKRKAWDDLKFAMSVCAPKPGS
jgi:DNA polymerase